MQQRFPQHLYCSEADFRNAIAALKVRGMLGRVGTRLIPQIIRKIIVDVLLCAGGLVEVPAR